MLTPDLLALRAQVPVRLVEDLEGGLETFLAPAIRQRLARVLHVRPAQIQELEKPPSIFNPNAATLQHKSVGLHEAILRDPTAPQVCPNCSAPLAIRLFERRDLQNNLLTVVKANCTQCLFRLADD